MKIAGMIVCLIKRKHKRGRPAFQLPENEPGNAEINSQLCIMECPRCGARWQRASRAKKVVS